MWSKNPQRSVVNDKRLMVAIWLQLEPHQELVGEGIAQHLAQLLHAWNDTCPGKAVLVAPRWSRRALEQFLCDNDLRQQRVSAKYCGPRILTYSLQRKTIPIIDKEDGADFYLASLLEQTPLRGIVGLAIAPFVPFIIILSLAGSFLWAGIRGPLKRSRNLVGRIARAITFAQMASYINRHSQIDRCLVPIGNWALCRLIKHKRLIVQIPDVVFLEFPELFEANTGVMPLMRQIRKVADRADAVVAVSEHVRRKHLIEFLGVPPSTARAVPHAPMTLDSCLMKFTKTDFVPSRQVLRDMLASAVCTLIDSSEYGNKIGESLEWLAAIRRIDVAKSHLLYYPTQYRPYKNIEGVIEALASLPRPQRGPVVLLLTADVRNQSTVFDVIRKHSLWDRVLPLPRLSQSLHALSLAASDLSITASRFEGGFPFVFSESVSVGTPVVMADTAITRSMAPPNLRPRMLFDTNRVSEIARVVGKALADKTLYREQSRVLFSMKQQRSWGDVLREFVTACDP